jgi:hypothetical protein
MDKLTGNPATAPGYETRDANPRGVFTFLVILGTVLVAVSLVCWGIFRYFTAHAANSSASDSPFADTRQLPLGPQLQVNPREDWLKYRDEQEKSLETYEWVNRSAGTVRIPIEKAMELLVKKGVPVQGESEAAVPPKPAGAGSNKP